MLNSCSRYHFFSIYSEHIEVSSTQIMNGSKLNVEVCLKFKAMSNLFFYQHAMYVTQFGDAEVEK